MYSCTDKQVMQSDIWGNWRKATEQWSCAKETGPSVEAQRWEGRWRSRWALSSG